MAWYICMAALAAFGLISAAWCVFGWLLPEGGGMMLCPDGTDAHAVARRYLWLRGLGLIRCPLLVTERDLAAPERAWMEAHGIEVCPQEELLRRLGIGEKEIDGTGNGDPPGCHQRRGISEL